MVERAANPVGFVGGGKERPPQARLPPLAPWSFWIWQWGSQKQSPLAHFGLEEGRCGLAAPQAARSALAAAARFSVGALAAAGWVAAIRATLTPSHHHR
jgi:hypothetical protein